MPRLPIPNPKTRRAPDYSRQTPHHVYRLFSASGDLLYVGVTEDVAHRVYMHLQTRVARDWQAFLAYAEEHAAQPA